jgi:predicted phosphohydrolase
MKIFAIADTHLSGQPPAKPMDIFGTHWQGHWDKIKTDWLAKVSPDDFVLLAGDISWALKLDEAVTDLEEIIALPGRKVIIRGNHDYWWQTITKMNKAVNHRLTFIHNNFASAGEIAICGSRGWICPGDPFFTPEDQVIYLREIERVRLSLEAAQKAGFSRIILMLHYPPVYTPTATSGFTELFAHYRVETCIFGHLHGDAISQAPGGIIHGTACHLVSCDALGFQLKQIL